MIVNELIVFSALYDKELKRVVALFNCDESAKKYKKEICHDKATLEIRHVSMSELIRLYQYSISD